MNFSKKTVPGFDLGGNDIKFGLTDEEGNPLTSLDPHQIRKVPSNTKQGPKVTVQAIKDAFAELNIPSDHQIVRCGLATAGPATKDGFIQKSTNYGDLWRNVNIREMVEQKLQVPTIYENDANSAGISEYMKLIKDYPEYRGTNGIIITLGTGTGTAIIADGRLLRGDTGMAGELGHFPMRQPISFKSIHNDAVCGCEKMGCVEASTSLRFLDSELRYSLNLKEYDTHPLQQVLDREYDRAKLLLKLADQYKDPLALKLLLAQATNVGAACADMCTIHDPSWFIIGGGITEASEEFQKEYLEAVENEFNKRCHPQKKGNVRFFFAQYGDHAGWYGAALSAVEDYRNNPDRQVGE